MKSNKIFLLLLFFLGSAYELVPMETQDTEQEQVTMSKEVFENTIYDIANKAAQQGAEQGIIISTPKSSWFGFFCNRYVVFGLGTIGLGITVLRYFNIATKKDLDDSSERLKDETRKNIESLQKTNNAIFTSAENGINGLTISAQEVKSNINNMKDFLAKIQKEQEQSINKTKKDISCMETSIEKSLREKSESLLNIVENDNTSEDLNSLIDGYGKLINEAESAEKGLQKELIENHKKFFETLEKIKKQRNEKALKLQQNINPLSRGFEVINEANENLLVMFTQLQNGLTEMTRKDENDRDEEQIDQLTKNLEGLQKLIRSTKENTNQLVNSIFNTRDVLNNTKSNMVKTAYLLNGGTVEQADNLDMPCQLSINKMFGNDQQKIAEWMNRSFLGSLHVPNFLAIGFNENL